MAIDCQQLFLDFCQSMVYFIEYRDWSAMNTKDEIRLKLIDLMDANGVSGIDLADAVGVSKQAVSAWRTGKSSIDIENVPAICEFFGVSIDDFFGARTLRTVQSLSEEEAEIVRCMRRANNDGRQAIISVARAVGGNNYSQEQNERGSHE